MLFRMNGLVIRPASAGDARAIAALMREAVLAFAPGVYSPRQIASALEFICRPDEQLIADGTYFVVVADTQLAGCGGWSRRRKVYSGSAAAVVDDELLDPRTEAARIRAMFVDPGFARRGIGTSILRHAEEQAVGFGFRRFQLVALRSAGTLYESRGYRAMEEAPITLEDGVVLQCTRMQKSLVD
jgi:GNAT superfamily N-acetyltransferase